jgi:hypothetical protein
MWRRTDEAKAYIKLFKSDKYPELRNPSGISRKINRVLKIKRVNPDVQRRTQIVLIHATDRLSNLHLRLRI